MSSRNVVLVVILAILARAGLAHADPPSAEDPVLQGLVGEALARNPQLVAAQQLERAAATRPAQAGARPGPTVGVFYQNDGVAPSLGREPMTMLGVTASQEIPYPGKLGLRRQVAQADAEMAGFDVQRVRLSLTASVKRAYYGLALARSLANLAMEHRKVWDEVRESARARYASAVGSQQEMLRAQMEATRVQALHAQHHAEARARLVEINALLARPLDTPVETSDILTVPSVQASAEEMSAQVEGASPELKAATLAVTRTERGVSLARLGSKPDFNVQGGVINRGGLPPMWQASASMMLPSRGGASAALAEAQARLAADQARLTDVRLRLRAVVEQRLALIAAAESIEATYREGLLPQGEVAVQSATATYAAGQGSQVTVLGAAAAVLEDKTDYLRILATRAMETTRLEEASLEPPTGIDSLLMHGRSTMPGAGSMNAPAAPSGNTMASSAGEPR
jgi:cobalt-zinc-cadmium efflux system outer membrane protein